MDIGRLCEAITVLNELVEAIEKLPADDKETAGLSMAFVRARNNLERLTHHYAQLCSFSDALWTTAMEGGIPSPDATAETALLLKWLADNANKE